MIAIDREALSRAEDFLTMAFSWSTMLIPIEGILWFVLCLLVNFVLHLFGMPSLTYTAAAWIFVSLFVVGAGWVSIREWRRVYSK